MDLESGPATLSRRAADRRSVSRAPALVGLGAQALPQRYSGAESLDEGPPKTPSRQGENRKTRVGAARDRVPQRRSPRKDSHRVGLLRAQRRADALPQVSAPAPVCRLRRDRSRLQDRHRFPPQTVRYVLDPSRRQRHHRATMLPSQQPLRGLLGGPPRSLTSTFMSHTRTAEDSVWRRYTVGTGALRRKDSAE